MTLNRMFASILAVAFIAGAGMLPTFGRSTAAQTTITTQARVIHASKNEGAIKVSFDGDKKIEDLDYGEVSDYVDLEPGDIWVEMEQEGLDVTDYVYSAVYPYVPAGNSYQLVLTDELVMAQLVDTTKLPEGKARLRLVQSSATTPAVDVVATGSDLVLIHGARYPFSTDYVEVDPGTLDLQIVQSGTTNLVLEVPGVTVEAGMVYDLILAGTPGDEEKPLQVITASTQALT